MLLPFVVTKGELWRRYDTAIKLALADVDSTETRRTYRSQLLMFFDWHEQEFPTQDLSRATVLRFRQTRLEVGYKAATVNVTLSAVRKLAAFALDVQPPLMDPLVAHGIMRVRGIRKAGRRHGNRLTVEQVNAALHLFDTTTPVGLRDRALFCVMVGSGLRIHEAAKLRCDQIDQVDGHWALLNVLRKGNKLQAAVPLPPWAKHALDDWIISAELTQGPVFRCFTPRGGMTPRGMGIDAIRKVINSYNERAGFTFRAHDLRRTFARRARDYGAKLEDIQAALGHSQIQTTMDYIGPDQNFERAACDYIPIELPPRKPPAAESEKKNERTKSAGAGK